MSDKTEETIQNFPIDIKDVDQKLANELMSHFTGKYALPIPKQNAFLYSTEFMLQYQ